MNAHTHIFTLQPLARNGVPVGSLMMEKVKVALGDWREEELNQFSWDFGQLHVLFAFDALLFVPSLFSFTICQQSCLC